MRATTAALLTALVAATTIVGSPRLAIGAGPLSPGHAEIENRCTACHAPFRGPRAERCVACHPADGIPSPARAPAVGADRLATLRALHRDSAAADCLACHTDHEGRDAARATKPFAHEAVQPRDAVHRGPAPCDACHGEAAWKPATFRHDSLDAALAARCVECHQADLPRGDGLHDPAMRACADCHGLDRWTPATFEHDRWFRLDRDHDVRCVTCHEERRRFTTYTCYGCHEHTPAGMRREHAEEGIARDLDRCARCHRSADEHGEADGDDD